MLGAIPPVVRHGIMGTIMTISLVIPAYNEETDIVDCLDAISQQDELPDEVIVVDNNSTDKTAQMARNFPFVTVIHEDHQGVNFARDAGFNAAKGDIIGRIDVDTYLPPDWVAQLKRVFEDLEVDAVTGPVFYKDMPGRQFGQRVDTAIRSAVIRSTIDQEDRDIRFLFGTNMALRRSSWQKVRSHVCHRKDMHEDIDLAIHLAEAGEHIAFDKDLVAGMSARRLEDSPQKFYKYIRMNDHTYQEHGIDSSTIKMPLMAIIGLYPGLKLIRRAYDTETQRLSIKKLLQSEEEVARKNPME